MRRYSSRPIRFRNALSLPALLLPISLMSPSAESEGEFGESVFVDSDGVSIHTVTRGEGPLVVLIHGFPDYWYTWRNQIPALSKHFKTVAVDMRGYNESGQPEGVENYRMDKLVADIAAIVDHYGAEKAIIVGHDWGGAVAWSFAMSQPEKTQRLVILNLPHPKGLQRELATNPEQEENSQYARDFQQPEAEQAITPEGLARWVRNKEDRKRYVEAFGKSSLEGMLNYYKANYPRPPYKYDEERPYPKVTCPVLMFHGLADKYLLSDGLNGTWDWLERDLTLVTIPGAGHFVQHDASDLVTKRMLGWLLEE